MEIVCKCEIELCNVSTRKLGLRFRLVYNNNYINQYDKEDSPPPDLNEVEIGIIRVDRLDSPKVQRKALQLQKNDHTCHSLSGAQLRIRVEEKPGKSIKPQKCKTYPFEKTTCTNMNRIVFSTNPEEALKRI